MEAITIKIDPEFKNLIAPLTNKELAELEFSLKADGCREALTIWDGILLDGHNRYEICQQLSIPFTTKSIECKDRDSAISWIITNQLARRNISLAQRTRLFLRREKIYKDQAKIRQREAGGDRKSEEAKSLPHNSAEAIPNRNEREATAMLARDAGTSRDTVKRVRVIEERASHEQKERLYSGAASINQIYTEVKQRKEKPAKTEKPNKKKADRVEEVKKLASQGMLAEQIAAEVGIHENTVKIYAKESGIALADSGIPHRVRVNIDGMIEQTVVEAENLNIGMDIIEGRINEIDISRIDNWIMRLKESTKVVHIFIKMLERRKTNGKQDN